MLGLNFAYAAPYPKLKLKSVVFFLAEELSHCIAPNVTILKIMRKLLLYKKANTNIFPITLFEYGTFLVICSVYTFKSSTKQC